jgi:hypothetical protein
VLADREGDRTSVADAAADDLTGARAALADSDGADTATGSVPVPGDVLVASTADARWRLRVDGVTLRRSETYGWANQFSATSAGDGTLQYQTPLGHRVGSLAQAALWLAIVVIWWRSRRRRGEPQGAPSREAVR